MEKITSRACIGEYKRALSVMSPPAWVSAIANMFESNQSSEEYPWLTAAPVMREWLGGRNAKGFLENSIEVKNRQFESTIEIAKKDMRRDKFGMIQARIQEQVRRALAHPGSLLSTLILNGASTACYDGQYFFDTDHSEGDSGTQSNDLSIDISALSVATAGTTTAPAVAEMQLCIAQAISAIVGFVDDKGEPMNEDASSFLVMVPPSLMQAAMTAVSTPVQVAETQTALSALKQDFTISAVVNPRLSDWTANFAVFRTDSYIKPFIFQRETAINVGAKAEGSEFEFDTGKHQYGVDYWGNVAYGLWQQACLVTMA